MTFIDAIILGILQGFTEFLPISSSGHLVLGQHLLGIHIPGNTFEVAVHMGTLLSVVVVFSNDILNIVSSLQNRTTQKYVLAILVGTLPAVIIGLVFKEDIQSAFDNIRLVSGALMVTGIILISTRWASGKKESITLWQGLWIGIAQAFAIIPGISRSGSTISIGLLMGLDPKQTARFSFLLAIPALAGAGLLTALDAVSSAETILPLSILSAGFISSFLVGWISLKWLLALLGKGKFYWFGAYCFILGFVTILF